MTDSDRRPAIRVDSRSGTRTIALESLLEPDAADQAEGEANRWIKSLRCVSIGGATFRDRFTHRGDSLWWFAELYLHKTRGIATAQAALRALEALKDGGSPRRITLVRGNADIKDTVRAFCRAHRIRFESTATATAPDLEWQGRAYLGAAALRHLRRTRPVVRGRIRVAAFVHSAFWRDDTSDEAYVGPVLRAIADRVPAGARFLVGLGPRTNFRARNWRARLRELREPFGITPVETFASWRSLTAARQLWRNRERIRRALEDSPDLRERSIVRGCDLHPLVSRQLAGIAYLQLPWSALAMDDAGAALDALKPDVSFTYAEAGGWGRALALESRRRGVPLVALQHGFIYRHWLNYQHEPDEVAPSPANSSDAGFPAPTLTLLHDDLAGRHLREAGRFDPASLRIVGSARLDGLVASARAVDDVRRRRLRAHIGADEQDAIVLVAAKYSQIARVFDAIVAAVRGLDRARLVIKCHPAETAEPYRHATAGMANATIASSDVDLGSLLAISRLLVTVNSTAAIEALVVGVPSLVVALPTNLSPFVEAGVMAGARATSDIAGALKALLYDEDRRAELAEQRIAFLERHRIGSDGHAAERAATAILECGKGRL